MHGNDPNSEDRSEISSVIEEDAMPLVVEVTSDVPMDLSDKNLALIPEKKKIYSRSVLATFSGGMVDPFLTTFAVDMGASGAQMGWLRAITNLLGNFMQPIFGFISDKVKQRSIFIALSGIISLVLSLGTPAWTALLGEIIPTRIRGRIVANVNWFIQLSAIVSTILGGIFLNYITPIVSIGSRTFPVNTLVTVSVGLAAGIASAIVMFTFKEKKAKERAQKLSRAIQDLEVKCLVEEKTKDDVDQLTISDSIETICYDSNNSTPVAESTKDKLKLLFQNKEYIKYAIIMGVQSFFMSMMWPLFPFRQRKDIPGVEFFEIAVFSVSMSIAMLLTMRYAGTVSDKIGRKPQMFANRLILAAMPISYAFATQIWHIIVLHVVICIFMGLTSTVQIAYLIDLTPEKDRSMYIGFYNMFIGVILFLGSLAGGYMVDILKGDKSIFGSSFYYTATAAVTITFFAGFIGRVITAFPFLALKEAKTFPYQLRDLPRLVWKSKKLPVLIGTIILLITFMIGFMYLMGYLP
ncbi:MAG: MFS transporter [Candidatus Heimdallarchaeota archaeon]